MLNYSPMNYAVPGLLERTRERASDALWVTYRWMSLGLATTALVALAIAHSPAALEFLVENRLTFFVLLFAQLGLVVALNAFATRMSTAAVAAMFFG